MNRRRFLATLFSLPLLPLAERNPFELTRLTRTNVFFMDKMDWLGAYPRLPRNAVYYNIGLIPVVYKD